MRFKNSDSKQLCQKVLIEILFAFQSVIPKCNSMVLLLIAFSYLSDILLLKKTICLTKFLTFCHFYSVFHGILIFFHKNQATKFISSNAKEFLLYISLCLFSRF